MLRRVHRYSLVSDLCLRLHMSTLEHEKNEIKSVKTRLSPQKHLEER